MKNKKYEKITSIICFIVFVILIIIAAYIQENKTIEVAIYRNYTVKSGEVLEDIAMRYYENIYLPKAKSDIKKLNNMTESDIYEGQVLKLEVK